MEMIERERPDLVAVCTTATGLQKPGDRAPSPAFRGDSHAEIAVDAANAGVPMLFVEKAMACSVRAADAVLAACREHGTLFNTGVMRRFNPLYHELRAMIERGDIGEPMAAVHHAKTTLMHGHIHAIDTVSYLLGDPGHRIGAGRAAAERHPDRQRPHRRGPLRHLRDCVLAGGAVGLAVPAGNWEYEVLGSEGSVRSLNNGRGMISRRASGQPFTWDHMPVPDAVPSGWGFNIPEGPRRRLRVGQAVPRQRGGDPPHHRGMYSRRREPPAGRDVGVAASREPRPLRVPRMTMERAQSADSQNRS